jgi:hypothetical protein
LIFSDHFSRYEPGVFTPLRDALLTRGDYYMHLADLKSYLEADQRLRALYADPDAWARKAILNVAGSGKFSSDRTIAEYAADIWKVSRARCRSVWAKDATVLIGYGFGVSGVRFEIRSSDEGEKEGQDCMPSLIIE